MRNIGTVEVVVIGYILAVPRLDAVEERNKLLLVELPEIFFFTPWKGVKQVDN